MKTPREIAVHESSHAIAAALYGGRPFSLSLDGDSDGTDGRIYYRQAAIRNAEDARKAMRIWLAGVAGERILSGTPLQPLGSDSSEAWHHARTIHGLDASPEVIEREVEKQLAEVEALLRQHWQSVMDLADASRQWFDCLDRFRLNILERDPIEIESPAPPALRIAASSHTNR